MMESANGYKYITSAATTKLAGNEIKKVVLHAIQINKTTTGTVTVQSDGSTSPVTIGIIAIGTIPGCYWLSTNGITIQDPQLVTSATEDISVFYTNIG